MHAEAAATLLIVPLLCACGDGTPELSAPWPGGGDLLAAVEIEEPSDIVFHPGRRTLFIVCDEGSVFELTTEGEVVGRSGSSLGDLEGIAVDPASGLIYAGIEGAERILELDPGTLDVRRRLNIDRHFNGELRLAPAGNGLESLCFVPDPDHPEGGTFFMTNQAMDNRDPADRSALIELSLPLRSSNASRASAQIVRYIPLEQTDLAAVWYDASAHRLVIASDEANLLLVIDPATGEVERTLALPGMNQEGIAFDDNGMAYIAQDSGGILRTTLEVD